MILNLKTGFVLPIDEGELGLRGDIMHQLIKWSDRYSVSHSDLDQQHQKLIQLINVLGVSIDQSRGNEYVIKVIAELMKYAEDHFQKEEQLLKDADYPNYTEHANEHIRFRNKVAKYSREMKQDLSPGDNKAFQGTVLNFMKEWLISHIMSSDKKYVPFLKTYKKAE